MPTRPFIRFGSLIGALALIVGGATAFSTHSASADTLLIESFTHQSVSDSAAWSTGGSGGSFTAWPGSACLTSSTNTTQSPIPGCGLAAPDQDGSGALRLTPLTTGRVGFVTYNKALPTTGGLDISFKQAQYGGSGADGLSLFLVDGTTTTITPGFSGGSLGYSAATTNTGSHVPGVTNGLIGIGLDKYGHFSDSIYAGSGCAAGTGPGSAGPGLAPNVIPNRVVVRGPGNGMQGYCFLGTSGDLGTLLTGNGTKAGSTVQVHIVIDPSTVTNRHVTVSLNGTQEVQVPVPQAFIDASTFKFGFSGSTGDVTDIHEIWDLQINSVIPVPPTTTTLNSVPLRNAAPAAPIAAKPAFTG